MKAERKAGLVILTSGILWGCISLFVRRLAALGLDLPQIVFLRALIAAVVLGGILAVLSPGKLRIRPRDIWMFIGTGFISLFCFNVFYFYTMTHGNAAVGGVLLYTSPAFILLLSAILFREKVTKVKLLALFFTLAGCLFVSGLCEGGQAVPARVLLCGILAGFLYSLYTIFGNVALRRYDAATVTFYTFLLASIAGLFLARGPRTIWQCAAEPKLLFWCTATAMLCSLFPYFLYTMGLRGTTPARASILVSIEPIVCCILGLCIYHEPFSILKLAGILFIITAILLQAIQAK